MKNYSLCLCMQPCLVVITEELMGPADHPLLFIQAGNNQGLSQLEGEGWIRGNTRMGCGRGIWIPRSCVVMNIHHRRVGSLMIVGWEVCVCDCLTGVMR